MGKLVRYIKDFEMKKNFSVYIENYKNLEFEKVQEKYRFKRLIELIKFLQEKQNFQNVLEIGPGLNSAYRFFENYENYTILEPIDYFFNLIKVDSPNIKVLNSTVEDFVTSTNLTKFELIIMSSVLHEIENPEELLKSLMNILSTDGKIVIILPNNKSLHRIIGEFEGFAKSGSTLTETEIRMQQNSSFSVESFTEFIEINGFQVMEIFTSFVKPFPHFKMHQLQLEGILLEPELDTLYSLSSLFNPYCSEIFAVIGAKNV